VAVEYKIKPNSLHDKFQKSHAKIQIFGGGFGNGKSAALCIKTLAIAKDYPKANILLARSTFPKLNDTLRVEFKKWCPKGWIKRDVNSGGQNIIELINGTTINFRYVAQQGKGNESSTSNLLSATYDLIVVDQVEDPEITYKDFLDLLGRMRGSAAYAGDDPTMPSSGPRMMLLACNPTRNWVYKKLVKPLQDLENGIKNPDLLVDEEGGPIIHLFEGSTYENEANLPEDFIKMQEAAYTGQMRDRYLLGKWGAFEGLVHPSYDPAVHMLDQDVIEDYYERLERDGFKPTLVEAYDHGLAQQACYLQGFVDQSGNVFWFRGLYEKEMLISDIAKEIKRFRKKTEQLSIHSLEFPRVLADPALFKRTAGKHVVGVTVAGLFRDEGIAFTKASNTIITGIAKVNSYLNIDTVARHPITLALGSPKMFFSNDLTFIDEEITDYFWKKDMDAEYTEAPVDRRDHAMNTIKYGLTNRPRIAQFIHRSDKLPNRLLRWSEFPDQKQTIDKRGHRHAA